MLIPKRCVWERCLIQRDVHRNAERNSNNAAFDARGQNKSFSLCQRDSKVLNAGEECYNGAAVGVALTPFVAVAVGG